MQAMQLNIQLSDTTNQYQIKLYNYINIDQYYD